VVAAVDSAADAIAGKRLLLVEDDLKLAEVVREFLEHNGFRVITEHHGDRVLGLIEREAPDLVILDIMLPGKDGLTICREARASYVGPIIMLTARGADLDEVLGLELGADDYLAKPVRPAVLLARIRSLLRRIQQPPIQQPIERHQRVVGQLVVNRGNRSATLGGAPIELTSAEFDLLWVLAERAGEPLTREALSQATRGVAFDGVDRTIDLRISALRTKLGDTRPPTLIKSIRGVGYQLAVG
jgi:DNA-binding response OmpR family regulator